MTKYKTYLFDADGTLLDYDKAELQALKKPFDFIILIIMIKLKKHLRIFAAWNGKDLACLIQQKKKYNHDSTRFIMTTLKAVFVNWSNALSFRFCQNNLIYPIVSISQSKRMRSLLREKCA